MIILAKNIGNMFDIAKKLWPVSIHENRVIVMENFIFTYLDGHMLGLVRTEKPMYVAAKLQEGVLHWYAQPPFMKYLKSQGISMKKFLSQIDAVNFPFTLDAKLNINWQEIS